MSRTEIIRRAAITIIPCYVTTSQRAHGPIRCYLPYPVIAFVRKINIS